MSEKAWFMRAGESLGGLVVGHWARMNGSSAPAYIVGLRKEGSTIKVLLHYLRAQPVDVPDGATSHRFEIDRRKVSCTWKDASVSPHLKAGLPTVYSMGTAPAVVPKGYSLWREAQGTEEEVQQQYAGQYVVLVKSAELSGKPGHFAIGVFAWTPSYERWRHGGWYVHGVRHPNGGCGCVSNNYQDRKWRIVCDDRRIELCEPGDFTYPTRDAAARAELEYINGLATL